MTAGHALCLQVVKRTLVLPTNHVYTFNHLQYVVSAMFLEYLGNGFEFWYTFNPLFLIGKLLFQSLVLEVLICEVVNGAVNRL